MIGKPTATFKFSHHEYCQNLDSQ